jgi:chorismate mutase
MYCTDKCAKSTLCNSAEIDEASQQQKMIISQALTQLEESLQNTNESIANCFVFTLENRNRLMDKIAEVKTQATIYGCGYLQELASLAEIVIMLLFRSNHYHDHQGLAQVEKAVQQMQLCFATNTLSEGHRQRIAETIENLWRWVDMNTLTTVRHF